ncbi:MAG: exo-alpha-sialidase [Oscillospiraceae bacterium]|nr:exo-alpha-sialidase [Oscillospiraceae bacterium]
MGDFRNIEEGFVIPTENGGYCDEPALAELKDGSWICAVTTSEETEGSSTQYVSILKSCDRGRTWSAPKRIEPKEDGKYWESSYSKMAVGPDGTVFCFYCYNDKHYTKENVGCTGYTRFDMGVSFCYRYSKDGGESWSPRHNIPIRPTKMEREYPYIAPDGKIIPFFWNVSKILVKDGSVYVPLTKTNKDLSVGEGVILKSEDLFANPDEAHWVTLPEGDGILKADELGDVCEEHSCVMLSDGSIVCTFRTAKGGIGFSVSRDGGRSFEKSCQLKYPDGRNIKNSRANNTFWNIGDGRFLFWFTNNGYNGFYARNPEWISAAVEIEKEGGKTLEVSQPEILLYSRNHNAGCSYPDYIKAEDTLYISETQKTTARTHAIPMSFINDIFRQFDKGAECKKAPDVLLGGVEKNVFSKPFCRLEDKNFKGVTLNFEFTYKPGNKTLIFCNKDKREEGVTVTAFQDGSIEVAAEETRVNFSLHTEPCLRSGLNKIAIVYDLRAGVVFIVVNGLLSDGGERCTGWKMIPDEINHPGENIKAEFDENVIRGGIYFEPLTVTDCVLLTR